MVFASLIFLCIFLPLNIIAYHLLEKQALRNALLTFLSLVFYAWGEPVWVTLLLFSAGIDYIHGLIVDKYRGKIQAKLALLSSIFVNLGLLALFKYNVFLYQNLNILLSPLGIQLDVPQGFVLPIGISFYTFQTISYVIDLYRGEAKVQRSFLNFLLFVCLYFQLVAGPIVRYAQIAEDIDNRNATNYDRLQGLLRFCIGLAKKVLIADVAATFVRDYLAEGDLTILSFGEAWFGIIMFSVQIYFDFSGYSDMAIGLARFFGFNFLENFKYPYISRSATDFWRRWHISLGSFFRDYVYIPLGGNRKNQYFNLFVVWFLTGLWHGPTWNFVLWGLYFGFLILIEKLFLIRILQALPRFISHVYLLIAAVFGWALFYFTDFAKLTHFLSLMLGNITEKNGWWSPQLSLTLQQNVFWLIATIILCMPIYPRIAAFTETKLRTQSPLTYALWTNFLIIILLLLSITMLVGNSYSPFIYERF